VYYNLYNLLCNCILSP